VDFDFQTPTPQYGGLTRVSVLFAYKNANSFVQAMFTSLDEKGYVSEMSQNNGNTAEIVKTIYKVYTTSDQHHARFEIRGQKQILWIDGKQIYAITYSKPLSGVIGLDLDAGTEQPPTIDNFVVSPLK
jgi:hypothetical protein